MIILDTDVLSALLTAHPDEQVAGWVLAQSAAGLFTTAVTEAELRYGLALMPEGRRRRALEIAVVGVLEEDLGGRVLPFDRAATQAYAEVRAVRRRAGRPMAQFDAQIAAIAQSRGATVATRNVKDFEGCGVPVVNPGAA